MSLKRCKQGTHKATGYAGCMEVKERHKYGLCKTCFAKWVSSTTAGQSYLRSSVIPLAKKEIRTQQQKQKQSAKIDLMSVDQYRKEKVQPIINEIIRIIDSGQNCIAQPNQIGSDAGHFHSVGSNRTLALNAHNIHLQSRDSNGFKGGESLEYYKGLIRTYGQDYADFCDSLRQIQPIKLTKQELKEVRQRALLYKKSLTKTKKSHITRLHLRNLLNAELNIYPKKWQQFQE